MVKAAILLGRYTTRAKRWKSRRSVYKRNPMQRLAMDTEQEVRGVFAKRVSLYREPSADISLKSDTDDDSDDDDDDEELL